MPFGRSKVEIIHCISTLEWVTAIPEHSLTSAANGGLNPPSCTGAKPVWAQCSWERPTGEPAGLGPCAEPGCSTSQSLLHCAFKYLLELLCKLYHFSARHWESGFPLLQDVSVYHPCSSSSKNKPKQANKKRHNKTPKIIYDKYS